MKSKSLIASLSLAVACLFLSLLPQVSNAADKPNPASSKTPASGNSQSKNPKPSTDTVESTNTSKGTNSGNSEKSTGVASNNEKPANANQGSEKANNSNTNAKNKNKVEVISAKDIECDTISGGVKGEPCSTYMVVFTPGSSARVKSAAFKSANSKVVRDFSNVFNGALIKGPASKIAALAKNPNIRFLEPDLKVTVNTVDNQPTWGVDRVDQRNLPLSSTFDYGANSAAGVNVYVVDTGINPDHVEFAGRILSGYSTIAGGVGDCNGHGTHVSGIIAGKSYGVARSANIVPVRVLDCAGGGTYSSVIAGLDWIAATAPAGVSAVVNMSLGGAASSTIDAAVKNLISRGLNVVVAAGNSNTDACTASPARVTEAITVGATTISDARASYSNFGSCLDIFAPGSQITSAWIGSTSASKIISGTSMASPLVAGVIARFVAANPTLSPSQVASSLKSGATSGLVTNTGSGSLNLLTFLEFAFDGSAVTQPTEQPKSTTTVGSSGNSKKPTTAPGKKK